MFLLLLVTALLQTPAQQPATAAPAATTDKDASGKDLKPATIRGKVTAALSGAPLKRAQITARDSKRPMEPVGASADAAGNYEIRGLDPGTYYVSCSKPGYVTMGYKAKKPNQGEPVTLVAEQVAKDIDCSLPRSGLITGTISDEDGEPIPNVSVQAMMKYYRQGKPQLQQRGSATSDDRGNFRIFDLPAGRYFIQAGVRNYGQMGSVGTFATIIYPNASRMADAQAVQLATGAEVAGINITMHEQQTYSVAGRVVDLRTGRPASGAFLNLYPEDFGIGTQGNAQTRPDGSFKLTNIAPGHYRLMVSIVEAGMRNNAAPFTKAVDVAGNVGDLNVGVGAGATIKGRLKAEGGDLPDKVRVSLLTRNANGNISFGGGVNAANADGTFEIADTQPGTYELQIMPVTFNAQLMGSYFLSEINVGNQDVTETGVVVPEGGGSLELSATLDFRGGSITGNVTDDDDKPMGSTSVALVNADPKKRQNDLYFKRGGTDSSGHFKLSAIIPGDYLLFVWPEDDPGQLLDPDLFLQAQKYGVPVSVALSSSTTKDLKLAPELRAIAQAFAQ